MTRPISACLETVGGKTLEIHFTPEQEAQLAQIASRDGKTCAGELLKDAALRLLEE